MNPEDFPLSWNKALLAIIPGLLATMGLVHSKFSRGMLAGLVLLVTFLVYVFWRNNRQAPAWSLMVLGMLSALVLTITSGVIAGLAALLLGKAANGLVLLLHSLFWGRSSARISEFLGLSGGLCALVIGCQLAVRIKYFMLFGVSWSVVVQWLNISLYAAIIALLLPVVLGWYLARRFGLATSCLSLG